MNGSLFQRIHFTSASGQPLTWKVECDALTDEDWATLAEIAIEQFGLRFSKVYGVPHGGLPFAQALRAHVTHDPTDPTLVVDDVWTTGGSMRTFMEANLFDANTIKLVAFARGPVPEGILALWTLGASIKR